MQSSAVNPLGLLLLWRRPLALPAVDCRDPAAGLHAEPPGAQPAVAGVGRRDVPGGPPAGHVPDAPGPGATPACREPMAELTDRSGMDRPFPPGDYPVDSTCNAFDRDQVIKAW